MKTYMDRVDDVMYLADDFAMSEHRGQMLNRQAKLRDCVEGLAAEADAEIAELRKDAARYRWLRSEGLGHIRWDGLTAETCDVGLDGAIDAHIKGAEA